MATSHTAAGASSAERAASMFRRVLPGAPLNASAVAQERMRKWVALPILSSHALSSGAYRPEAMLAVLALAGSAALGVSLRLSEAIVVLMIAVGRSYRQGHQGVSARRTLVRRGRQEPRRRFRH